MKKIFLAVAFATLSAVSFAGAEVPAVSVAPPPVYQPLPVYQPVATPVVVQAPRKGFIGSIVSYSQNRLADVGDIVCETFDGVVGLVTLDPAKDDQF